MKKIKILIATTICLLIGKAEAGPLSVRFDKPLTLSGEMIFQVERETRVLKRSSNTWKVRSSKKKSHLCSYSLILEGRDLATENKLLGEHLYGTMEFECERRSLLRPAFKMKFSRVLVTGIRNCIKSETVIDNDYCELVVLAFQRETDKSKTNGDILSQKFDKIVSYKLNSSDGQKFIMTNELVPQGINHRLLDSFQVFGLNMGKDGRDFFIHEKNNTSSLGQGLNHFIELAQVDIDRDIENRKLAESKIEELELRITDIATSADPKDEFRQNISKVLSGLNEAMKRVLNVMGPVDYFNLEKRVALMRENIVALAKENDPNVSDQDSFDAQYVSRFQELQKTLYYVENSYTSELVSIFRSQQDGTPYRANGQATGGIVAMAESNFKTYLEQLSNLSSRGIAVSRFVAIINSESMTTTQFHKLLDPLMRIMYWSDVATCIDLYYNKFRLRFTDIEVDKLLSVMDRGYSNSSVIEALYKRILADRKDIISGKR